MASISSPGADQGPYYSAGAYHPDAVPSQPDQREDPNHSRLGRSAGYRLPWGNTRDVIPRNLFSRWPPKVLREIEKRGDLLIGTDDQGELDHERICYAPLAFRSRLINVFEIFGKGGFWILTPIAFSIYLTDLSHLSYNETWFTVLMETWSFYLVVSGIPALMWLSAVLTYTLFPNWCLKAGRGPDWEINRRTGMVSVWRYPRKWPFLKRRAPTVIRAPFYEFDGWVSGAANQVGPRFDFVLCHRYQKLEVHVGDTMLGWHHFSQPCYALWDFIQNYMDVTRPLPELPLFERHRHKDPVTAEHDRETGRPERYWRDMDDDTFKHKEEEMHRQVQRIDTERRVNLMAEKVRYAFMYPEDLRAYSGNARRRESRSERRWKQREVQHLQAAPGFDKKSGGPY